MKSYKIDLSGYEGRVREIISEAVQKKAFSLGYVWADGSTTPILTDCPYLYMTGNMIKKSEVTDEGRFRAHENTPISVECFLELNPEPKTRQMTRGEVLYMVTTTPAMVVRERGGALICPAQFANYISYGNYEYAIIDKTGEPIDGWHKFEVTE